MISKEKQKAILEALLFVSPEPLSVSKMVQRLKQVEHKQQEEILQKGLRDDLRARMDGLRLALPDTASQDPTPQTIAEASQNTDDPLEQLLTKREELEQEITNADVKALLSEMAAAFQSQDRGIELIAVAKGYQLRTKGEISECLKDEKVASPTRLTSSSLEALAVVAYEQPVTRQRMEQIRGVDCGGVLKTLLDKGFIHIVGRSEEAGRSLVYGTTKRFLEIFSLNALGDLPSLEDYHSLQMTEEKTDHVMEGNVASISETESSEPVLEDFSEEDGVLMADLDASLKNLDQVEKAISPSIKGSES